MGAVDTPDGERHQCPAFESGCGGLQGELALAALEALGGDATDPGAEAPLDAVARQFGLSEPDAALLAVCVAAEERVAAHLLLEWLSRSVELAGGDIRNMVLAAVYSAVASGSRLGMRHLDEAVQREHIKLGRRPPAR